MASPSTPLGERSNTLPQLRVTRTPSMPKAGAAPGTPGLTPGGRHYRDVSHERHALNAVAERVAHHIDVLAAAAHSPRAEGRTLLSLDTALPSLRLALGAVADVAPEASQVWTENAALRQQIRAALAYLQERVDAWHKAGGAPALMTLMATPEEEAPPAAAAKSAAVSAATLARGDELATPLRRARSNLAALPEEEGGSSAAAADVAAESPCAATPSPFDGIADENEAPWWVAMQGAAGRPNAAAAAATPIEWGAFQYTTPLPGAAGTGIYGGASARRSAARAAALASPASPGMMLQQQQAATPAGDDVAPLRMPFALTPVREGGAGAEEGAEAGASGGVLLQLTPLGTADAAEEAEHPPRALQLTPLPLADLAAAAETPAPALTPAPAPPQLQIPAVAALTEEDAAAAARAPTPDSVLASSMLFGAMSLDRGASTASIFAASVAEEAAEAEATAAEDVVVVATAPVAAPRRRAHPLLRVLRAAVLLGGAAAGAVMLTQHLQKQKKRMVVATPSAAEPAAAPEEAAAPAAAEATQEAAPSVL